MYNNNVNSIYGIFDTDYIQQQSVIAATQKFESNQHNKVLECARKLDEFMKSTTEIAPQFQGEATATIWAILIKYL